MPVDPQGPDCPEAEKALEASGRGGTGVAPAHEGLARLRRVDPLQADPQLALPPVDLNGVAVEHFAHPDREAQGK
jgi:hypothetical protein